MSVPDLSKLGQKQPDDGLHDLGEITPREANTIKSIMAQIQEKFGGRPMTEANQLMMGHEIVDRFENELQMKVILTWAGVEPDPKPGNFDLHYLPQIDVLGRLEAVATDHDQIKHQIQTGEADGQIFYVREDGTKTDEPLRKSF